MTTDALAGLVILSAVNAAITTIVTEGTIFDGLRDWLGDMSPSLGQAVSCPLCCGTWVGAAIAVPTVYEAGYADMEALLAGVVVTFASLTGAMLFRRWLDV